MTIIIEAPFTITPVMKVTIDSKLESLDVFSANIDQANVFFKLGDGNTPQSVLSEIRLRIPGNDLFASAPAEEAMKAFNEAANQVKAQLIERNEILRENR